jgi:hypothetical protein
MRCVVVILLLTGCASQPEQYMADAGQTADVASTATALASGGFVELNPIAIVAWPVKFMLAENATHQKREWCEQDQKGIAAIGWGAAAWNTALIAGGTAATGGLAAIGIPVLLWPLIDKGAEVRCEDARPRTQEERIVMDEKQRNDRAVWGL